MTFHIEDVARIAHEANRAIQQIQQDPGIAVSPPWDELDEHTSASVIDGVAGVLGGNEPEASHENWSAFKRADGWVYGPVKDADAKTHPCLVPYADLPPEQKAKDGLFGAIVNALAPYLEEH